MERSPEEALDVAHRALSQAGFLIITMLVKRRLNRAWLETAIAQVKLCLAVLDKLLEYVSREK